MTTDSTTDTDIAPPRPPASWLGSLLRFSGPFIVLGIVGWINGIGAWPAFRQQDTSLLHWNLASNSEALKGLSQDIKSEGPKSSNDLRHHLRNYLTLENMNLSGLDLSSSDLSDMSLENVSLAGTRLVNADFSCTDLSGVDFSGAKLMNSRLDYSRCKDPAERHISTKNLHCSQEVIKEVNNANLPFLPFFQLNPESITCLEATFVGADLSKTQIRGDWGRRSLGEDKKCERLLVLVGNMSGAVFNEANLTCVALIHQADSPAPVFLALPYLVQLQNWYAQFTHSGENAGNKVNQEQANSTKEQPSTKPSVPSSLNGIFNGISFTGARLDRVSLLKGPFRFSQFERAQLMGLFLNIGVDKTDLDYSRFNEINCEATAIVNTGNSKGQPKYWPCLLVRHGTSDPNEPLHLNLLWSTLVTNLKPIGDDSFLCTPKEDLPAWVEGKRLDNAGFWLTPGMGPEKFPPKQLDCPAANYPEPNNSFYPEANRRWHHVLSSSQLDSKSPSKAVQ